MSILEEAIDNAVMGSSQNRETVNSGEFEEAIIATEGRENEHMRSEVGRNTSEGANEVSTGLNEERGFAGMEPKEQVEEGVSLVPEIEENGREEEEEEEVNVNQAEENARVPEVECRESDQGEGDSSQDEQKSGQGERESDQGERESDQGSRDENEQNNPKEVSSETSKATEAESETVMEVDEKNKVDNPVDTKPATTIGKSNF